METKISLREDTKMALQELVQINIDSGQGFLEAGEAVDDDNLRPLFNRLSADRFHQANELKTYLEINDETPEDSGSVLGALHRTWMALRAAINEGDPSVILIEAERGEETIREKYADLIANTRGEAMHDILTQHYEQVREVHRQIRNLRDIALGS